VFVRNRDGEHHCRDCGFDTDLEVFPATAASIGYFRDLKNAIFSFEQSLTAMKWAQAAAVAVLGYTRPHERIEQVSLDGKSRRTLLEVYNVYSYPHVSANGATLALVTDNHGMSTTLRVLDLAGGKVGLEQTTSCLKLDGFLSSPRLSPSGARILFYRRDCRRCPNNLELVGASGSNRTTLVDGEEGTPGLALWAGDKAIVYGVSYEGPGQLMLRNVNDDSERMLLDGSELSFRDVAVSTDGTTMAWITDGVLRIVADEGQPCGELADRDPKSKVDQEPCAEPRILTSNNLRDRYPRWAPDAPRQFTETSHDGVDRSVVRMSVRWTEP
jgi:hypothetical protein